MATRISQSSVLAKIKLILNPEYPFYISSIIYGIGVSVLTLAIPISVQSLVNTVAFGVLTQPLVVLSIVLLLLLLFSGVLNALQVYVIELFQRRFFARTTLEVTQKLLKSSHEFVYQQNAVEFTNRFFDVMTVQKSFTTLITGGVAVILQTLVGLILLAFYHPYFLVFDILLIISLYYIWALFWRDALGTAVVESKAKYKVASWLEEVARENLFFKSNSRMEYALKVSDKNVIHYLDSRSKHFKTVFYQTILLLGTYALMSSLILGLGGYLVIEGQLTLGQLVAAELVVTVILASFSKAGKFLESFYDLFAAIDKLSQFYDLKPSVKQRKIDVQECHLDLEKVRLKTDTKEFYFNYKFEVGMQYQVKSQFYSQKLAFLDLLKGIQSNFQGQLKLGGVLVEPDHFFTLHDHISIIDREIIIDKSIYENLTMGNKVEMERILDVLEVVELSHLKDSLENGFETRLLPSGYPLWPSQVIRLNIAREVLRNPKVIIFTEIFDQIEINRRLKILNFLKEEKITAIIFSNRDELSGNVKYISLNDDGFDDCKDFEDFKRR